MEEELELYIEVAEDSMKGSIEHFKKGAQRIRSGKASPVMFEGVQVDYYGSSTPISQVANIKAQDGRTLIIAPWEKSMLATIEHQSRSDPSKRWGNHSGGLAHAHRGAPPRFAQASSRFG